MTGEENSFDFMVISVLRGILDSYYCEFVYNGENVRENPQFVDYAYYWLGKYKVDEETRKIVSYEAHNDEDNNRLW